MRPNATVYAVIEGTSTAKNQLCASFIEKMVKVPIYLLKNLKNNGKTPLFLIFYFKNASCFRLVSNPYKIISFALRTRLE